MAELTGAVSLAAEAYERAQVVWENRVSNLAAARWNWQVMSLLLLLSNLGLVVGLGWVVRSSGPVPFLVAENELGELASWGPIERLVLEDRHVIHALRQWIEAARGVSKDPRVQGLWVEKTYGQVSRDVSGSLNRYYEANNPYERAEVDGVVVAVEVKTIQRVAGDSWQIRWKETELGRIEEITHHQAIVEISFQEPENLEDLMKNPTGLLIKTLSWAEEVGAQ